jgi:small subunit ribosomal protein S3Ae
MSGVKRVLFRYLNYISGKPKTNMAKKNTKKVSKIKIKKKTWYKIQAPTLFASRHIGETYLANAQSAIGRVMTVNLKDLTDSFRDQSMYVTLKLENIKDQKFTTSIVGYSVIPSFIKRMARKRTSRLDDVFTVTTKEGKQVLIKAIAIAMFKSNRSVGTALRLKMQEIVTQTAQRLPFEAFASEIITGKVKMSLKRELKKLYPVKEAIVREFKLVQNKKAAPITVFETKESHEKADEHVEEVSKEAANVEAKEEVSTPEPMVEAAENIEVQEEVSTPEPVVEAPVVTEKQE